MFTSEGSSELHVVFLWAKLSIDSMLFRLAPSETNFFTFASRFVSPDEKDRPSSGFRECRSLRSAGHFSSSFGLR